MFLIMNEIALLSQLVRGISQEVLDQTLFFFDSPQSEFEGEYPQPIQLWRPIMRLSNLNGFTETTLVAKAQEVLRKAQQQGRVSFTETDSDPQDVLNELLTTHGFPKITWFTTEIHYDDVQNMVNQTDNLEIIRKNTVV